MTSLTPLDELVVAGSQVSSLNTKKVRLEGMVFDMDKTILRKVMDSEGRGRGG
ncbi:hypothetical protein ACLOJK_001254 [Asimina triloba]